MGLGAGGQTNMSPQHISIGILALMVGGSYPSDSSTLEGNGGNVNFVIPLSDPTVT